MSTMSKDDGCKVTSACKHKERKPKKPHYIPRPWGKPYNYKCFQCPFTCMEKSHLYNHMKYSLCKNSLSLLIESDWPYKKGNILHPDQLRPLQQAHGIHAPGKDEPEQATGAEDRPRQQLRSLEEEGEDRESQGAEEEEEGGRVEGADEVVGLTRESSSNSISSQTDAKRGKRPESELFMADMYSLEDQLLRARSIEVEAQLKQYKLSKTCLTAPGLLSEQWRLLTTSHAKGKSEGAQSRVGSSIPCYPPPPNLVDYQDPTGLNLSLLGVGYPISPGLFSYVNSAIPTAASNVTAHNSQLAQLPFLASAAQLMHPASSTHPHTDRALLPPRLYYPFLCEHTFGTASAQNESGKGHKASTNSLEPTPLPGYQSKVNLWKVPALRPGTSNVSPVGWASPQRESPDPGHRLGDRLQVTAKETTKAGWGLKRTGAPLGSHEAPMEKKPTMGFTLDLLKNIHNASPLTMATDKFILHSSLQSGTTQTRPAAQWYHDPPTSPNSESVFHAHCGKNNGREGARATGEGASESVAALLNDLSKALQEYQEAEHKISHLEKEDLPAQGHLWEHLSKIRSELSHIHQALERTARQSEGPLDLSVKKDVTETVVPGEQGMGDDGSLKDNTTETEEEDEEAEEEREEDDDERKALKASLESRKQSLDMLIKMSQAGMAVVNADVLSPGGLGLRPSPAEALWPGRTTKCEADSSVLLCPDGRPIVFTDIPSSAKTPKRPPSIQRLEAQCPQSPLTAADS